MPFNLLLFYLFLRDGEEAGGVSAVGGDEGGGKEGGIGGDDEEKGVEEEVASGDWGVPAGTPEDDASVPSLLPSTSGEASVDSGPDSWVILR